MPCLDPLHATTTHRQQQAVFVLAPHAPSPPFRPGDLHLLPTEAELLTAWMDWLAAQDPDCLLVYQVEHSLGALIGRMAALGLRGGSLRVGRLLASPALALKRVTMYSAAWVKSQVGGCWFGGKGSGC